MRAKTTAEKRGRGTYQKCRDVVPLHGSKPAPAVAAAADHPPPRGMSNDGRKIWRERVAAYLARGQDVSRSLPQLRIYCELEASINKLFKEGKIPSVALLREHRQMTAMFGDAPAQPEQGDEGEKGNRFAGHGRRKRPDG